MVVVEGDVTEFFCVPGTSYALLLNPYSNHRRLVLYSVGMYSVPINTFCYPGPSEILSQAC